MWCVGLILLLFSRIESLQCPERCHCVQTASDPMSSNSSVNATYQITCHDLHNLSGLLRHLPSPTTQLIAQRTVFLSIQSLHQTLVEMAQALAELTDFSITNSVVKSNEDQTTMMQKFPPFASFSNTVPKGSGFTHLQILNLSNNTLTYLPEGLFHSCSCLQTLDLSNNLIKNFETEIFHPLINLLRLDLRRNHLRTLNEAIFRNLSKLLTLDVSHNEITRVAPTTFQFLTSLNTLILAENPLSSGLVLLGAGHHLQVVDVSNTGLRQAPTMLERTARTLQLQGNTLTAVRCGDLDSYSLLFSLNLDSNHISYVEEDAMGRLELLAELQLSHNKLFHVPRSLPDNLQLLDLSFNLIQNISNADFLNLSLLKELSLSNNQIHYIETSAFKNLANLRSLDLSRNPVLELPPLLGLTQLQVLNLSYLTNVSRVWRLGFSVFPVPSPGSIKELRLEASPALSQLFLTDTSTLQHFLNLSELHLRFSNLTILRKDIFTLLPALKVLKLEGNPWHCDREMLFTAQWLQVHGASAPEDGNAINAMHCATPPRLHGRLLAELSPKDFQDLGRTHQIEKLNSLEIFKNQSSFKMVQGNPSGARIYLKSYENSIESVDNSDVKIEKTSDALGDFHRETKPGRLGDNDSRLSEGSFASDVSLNVNATEPNCSSYNQATTGMAVMPTEGPVNNSVVFKSSDFLKAVYSGVKKFKIKNNILTSNGTAKKVSENILLKKGGAIFNEQLNRSRWIKQSVLNEKQTKLTLNVLDKSVVTSATKINTVVPATSTISSSNSKNLYNATLSREESHPPHFGSDPGFDEVNVTGSDADVNRTEADALSAHPAPTSTHPGMFIMVLVGVVVVAALALTVQHVSRTRRDQGYVLHDQEMQVHCISSPANDLW